MYQSTKCPEYMCVGLIELSINTNDSVITWLSAALTETLLSDLCCVWMKNPLYTGTLIGINFFQRLNDGATLCYKWSVGVKHFTTKAEKLLSSQKKTKNGKTILSCKCLMHDLLVFLNGHIQRSLVTVTWYLVKVSACSSSSIMCTGRSLTYIHVCHIS